MSSSGDSSSGITIEMLRSESETTHHPPPSEQGLEFQKDSTKQAKRNRVNIKSYLFDNHVIPTLELHGWTCSEKERVQKSTGDDTTSSSGPAQIDRLFIPPEVTPNEPFKIRRDYFDSRSQVLKYIENKPDKYGMSSYLLRFVDSIDSIIKRDKRGELLSFEK
eukprot:5548923-Ditylum_brightwellii.AAC.1